MPRRTVSVSNVFVHTERKTTDRKAIDNFDGKGADLLSLLRGFIHGLDADLLVDDATERYVRVTELEPKGRTLLCAVEAGYYGTDGKVTNVKTHLVEHEHSAESATTRTIRFLVVAPKGALGMLVFIERVGGVGAGNRVLSLFHSALRHKYADQKLTFKVETMVETDAWMQKAELERVSGTVTAYDYSGDIADSGEVKVIGKLSVDLEPTGNQQYLPKRVWTGLKAKNLDAAKVLGLNEDLEVDELQVKVAADGKSKTFAIDKEKQPSLSYLFAQRGVPDVDTFAAFCADHAKDLLPSVGAEWDARLTRGSWGADELAVKLEMPGEE